MQALSPVSYTHLIFCAGAVFSWITVYISAHRSLKIASRISPVEAAKYTPKKRKNLFTILSFALSGIMFMAASNVTLGYSVDKMIQRYNCLLYTSVGWTRGQTSLCFYIYFVVFVGGNILGGRLQDRYSPKVSIVYGCLLYTSTPQD